MGMFDYVICEAELPGGKPTIEGGCFQSKDTPDQCMTVYTITADGRLTWRSYTIEEVPIEERAYPDATDWKANIGRLRRVEGQVEDVLFHGNICFYGTGPDGAWNEYMAQFTKGRLAGITKVIKQ